ncbi:MAG: hypothetical protein ACMXX5_01605 [Candidatus Woesearchaeota archaeon]
MKMNKTNRISKTNKTSKTGKASKTNKINYYQMHHHMKQSGVRTVIEDIFESLSKDKSFNLNLIYSSEKGIFRPTGYKVNAIDITQVDYDNYIYKGKQALLDSANDLKNKIKKNLDLSSPCVLHCHNAGLFKNSCLTAALMMLAKDLENKDFLLLFQHHDFAEEKRPNRLHLMMNCTGKKDRLFGSRITYPIGKNIHYMSINSRDYKLLNLIGIPKSNISIYHNAIDTKIFHAKPMNLDKLKNNIAKYAKQNNYFFDLKRKILLSPLKLIERKNIAETLLILKLLNKHKDEWQLLITLEGSSPDDVRYGDKIKAYIRKNKLPVTIGFGYKLLSPDEKRGRYSNNITDMFALSDAVITTSVQEGFGFCYIEGWVAGKKVIGRRLDYIFRDFERNNLNMKHFYKKIMVNKKDFPKHTVEQKIKLLDKADYGTLLNDKELKKTIDVLYSKDSQIVSHNRKLILKHYSKESYLTRIKSIISKANKVKKQAWKKNPKIDNLSLIRYFKSLE